MKLKTIKSGRILLLFLLLSAGAYSQQILTIGEVFDFQPGDEFHYIDQNTFTLEAFETKIERIRIKTRYDSPEKDTIYYTREIDGYEFSGSYRFFQQTDTVGYSHPDSSIYTYIRKKYLYFLSDKDWLNVDEIFTISDSLFSRPQDLCKKPVNAYRFGAPDIETLVEFGQGLGLAGILEKDDECNCNPQDYQLFYYKKGTSTCGTPDERTNTSVTATPGPAQLHIYPNPSDGKFYILNSAPSQAVSYRIYTVSHKMVGATAKGDDLSLLDLSLQPDGIYFLQLIYPGKTETFRLIKNSH